jgi:YtoQ family protein
VQLKVYLSGEIHTDWREQIIEGIQSQNLPIEILTPVVTHDASDNVGISILGEEDKSFWKDHKAAKINAIRIRGGIERADLVVVKFGEQYRQWNAAFDAGYAAALGKTLIVIHPEEFTHALKEVDASASAVAQTPDQVVSILAYVATQK